LRLGIDSEIQRNIAEVSRKRVSHCTGSLHVNRYSMQERDTPLHAITHPSSSPARDRDHHHSVFTVHFSDSPLFFFSLRPFTASPLGLHFRHLPSLLSLVVSTPDCRHIHRSYRRTMGDAGPPSPAPVAREQSLATESEEAPPLREVKVLVTGFGVGHQISSPNPCAFRDYRGTASVASRSEEIVRDFSPWNNWDLENDVDGAWRERDLTRHNDRQKPLGVPRSTRPPPCNPLCRCAICRCATEHTNKLLWAHLALPSGNGCILVERHCKGDPCLCT
jgi:hypothetical protein